MTGDAPEPRERSAGFLGLMAECTECGETFVPADEDDTIHLERHDGTPCGGEGIILGEWTK